MNISQFPFNMEPQHERNIMKAVLEMKLGVALRACNEAKVVFVRNGKSKGVKMSREENKIRLDQELKSLWCNPAKLAHFF